MAALDGQTFRGQGAQVVDPYVAAYGDDAEAQWEKDHNAATGKVAESDRAEHTKREGRTGGLGQAGGFIGESPEEEAERLALALRARQAANERQGKTDPYIATALKGLEEAKDAKSLAGAIQGLRGQVIANDIVAVQVIDGETSLEVPEGATIGSPFQSVGQQASRDAETARRAAVAEATRIAKQKEKEGKEVVKTLDPADPLRIELEAALLQIQATQDELRKVQANLTSLEVAESDAKIRLDAFSREQQAVDRLRQPGAGFASLFSQRRPANRAQDPIPSALGALLADRGVPQSGNVLSDPVFIDPTTFQGSNNVFRDLIRSLSVKDLNALSSDPTLRANFDVVGNVLGGDPSRALATAAQGIPREGRIRSVLFG
jgi:hypothetical protein